MATIKLAIVGDTKDAYAKIEALEAYAKKMKPIQLKFSAVGLNEVSKNALALAKVQAQVEISANKAAEAERKAAAASLAYGKQAETTRTQEARRAAETQKTATAVVNLATQQEKTRTATQQYATQTEKTRTAEVNRAAATEKARAALSNLRGEQDRTATSSGNLLNSIHQIGDAYSKLWSRITSTVTRRLINQAFTALRSTIKDTLDVMKDVDTQLINIQKVSGKTSEEIAAIGERAYDTAAKYGVAVEDYLSAVYSFQKAGLGESAESLAELATKTMLVGDTTAAVAEKFLISSNAAWELHGNIDELNKVIDQADYINNNYATTLDKIAAGLPIVASVAANAGMTYSETMAALGTIQSITQESGTKSATALRALILNIEKEAGTYLTEEGEEFEVTAESIKGLQGLLEKYAATEMEAARASGELLNPMTAIKALFEGMQNKDVTDIELFQLLSAMGGKLRTNQLTALVKNFDMFDQMLQQIGDSAGTADNEVELMMQSWEKKSQVLKDRWQQFIAQLVSTDAIKGLIDDITEFVVNLDPAAIGAAIRDTLYPVLDFIKNVDWAGSAQKISEIFDKIMAVGKGTAIAATIGAVIGGLEKIIGFLGTIGGLLGVGGIAGVAAGGGIIGGLVLIGTLVKPWVDHLVAVDRLTESADRLSKTVKEQRQELADNKAEIDAAGTVVGIYIDQLERLEQQGLDDAAAMDEYNTILDNIVTIMPELSEAVKEANGDYTNFSATLRDNAEAWIENATAQAYRSEIEAVASEKAKAELEKARNERELYGDGKDDKGVNGILLSYDKLKEEWNALDEQLHAPDVFFETAEELYAAQERARELGKELRALDADADIQAALARREELEDAIAESERKIAAANEELEKTKAAYKELTGYSATGPGSAFTAVKDAIANVAQENGALSETKKGFEEVEGAAQDTEKAIEEIPDDKDVTLVPHFDEAIQKIQEYIGFLEHIKGTYTSTLTSTVYHEAYNRDAQGNLLPGFYDGSRYGGSGVIGRAAGGVVSGGGKTLVNELGPELISENGRAYIAGGGKPTVVNLSPGAIVIPADETAEAMRNGMPKYAAAYAGSHDGMGHKGALKTVTAASVRSMFGATTSEPAYTEDEVKKAVTKAANNLFGTGGSGSGSASGSGSGPGKGSGKGAGTGGGSATITFDFKSLETALTNTLGDLADRIKLAENEGNWPLAAELYEKSQEAVKDLVDKYRQAGYSDESPEIVKLLNKNYELANKQLKLYQDKWDDLVKALEADTDATKALKELEEKRAALEESVAAYENAQKQRTVRIYNAETGQWEWIADQKKIDAAREKIDSAQESYNDAVKKQAIEELKKMGENISDLSDIVLGPALSAVVTMSEDSQEFQNFAAALNAVFGVGSFLQSTEGTKSALSTVDSHDTHYSFGGVDITPEQAGSMTLAQLAQMLQVLKIT